MESNAAKTARELFNAMKQDADEINVGGNVAEKLADALKNVRFDFTKLNGVELVLVLGMAGLCLLAIIAMVKGYVLEWSGEYGDACCRILLRKE